MRGHKEGVPTIGPRSKALRETKAVPNLNFLPKKLLLRHHLNNASIVSSIINVMVLWYTIDSIIYLALKLKRLRR